MRDGPLRVVVVTWDLAHHGASAAYTLADLLRHHHDVEILGPRFLGPGVWPPIRDCAIPIRTFPGRALPEFVADAERFVEDLEADLVVVCKPRFPALLLAMLVKDACGAPVLLHIDDFELGLVGGGDPLSLEDLGGRRSAAEFANPGGRLWTAACESLIGDADGITVSGAALQGRYGGVVLGQPRDESRFDPTLVDRASAREALGYRDADRVVLFLGSPRRHKGIQDLAAAIAAIDDPRVKLCVIGTFAEPRLRAEIAAAAPGRIQLIDDRPFADVPHLLALGDLVCLPQDPRAPFVAFQTPMKLIEALAMEVPVLLRETASLTPFVAQDVVATIGERPLADRIVEVLGDVGAARERARRGRRLFVEQQSYAAARRSLAAVIAALPEASPSIPPRWERACDIAAGSPG